MTNPNAHTTPNNPIKITDYETNTNTPGEQRRAARICVDMVPEHPEHYRKMLYDLLDLLELLGINEPRERPTTTCRTCHLVKDREREFRFDRTKSTRDTQCKVCTREQENIKRRESRK